MLLSDPTKADVCFWNLDGLVAQQLRGLDHQQRRSAEAASAQLALHCQKCIVARSYRFTTSINMHQIFPLSNAAVCFSVYLVVQHG